MAESRWEKKVEQYKKNEAKYIEMKDDIKNLKEGKVTGNFKTKEEYENALNNRKSEISKMEKDYQGYENFKNNEDKLNNILEYRKSLEQKLEKLPKDTSSEVAKKQEEKNELETKIAKYQKSIGDMKKTLRGDIDDETKKVTEFAIKTRTEALGELQENLVKKNFDIANLQEEGKDFNEKATSKKELYERRIAKCNLLAANLLKGKAIEDIELRVHEEGKKYTSKDGKLEEKIDIARQENEKENVQKGNKENVQENDEAMAEKADIEEELKNNSTEALTKASKFAQKHPRLAKIGNFFKNIKNKIADVLRDDEAETSKEKSDKNEEKLNKEDIEKSFKDEDELLKKIAVQGKEKTFKEMVKVNRTKAANEYAKNYGGAYERQDGATEKKTENKDKSDGMEPGDE